LADLDGLNALPVRINNGSLPGVMYVRSTHPTSVCYSDFTSAVRPIYDHPGYVEEGVLKDYMIPGHNEILMRKTTGPVMEFQKKDG
jgi:hypothetical protein